MLNNYLDKTLEELEGETWGEPQYGSNLVVRCHELRRKPLMDFSVEDLRIMIGQGFSLKYLVPIALRYLADNPFVRGDFYKGDLLVCVINIEQTFWDLNPETYVELDSIITSGSLGLDFPVRNCRWFYIGAGKTLFSSDIKKNNR
jgi:hypothetical protein